MPRPTHFEIHAADPARAEKFYSELFGWNFQKWDGPMEYWLVMTGDDSTPGIHGGMLRRQGDAPAHGQAVNAFPCTVGGVEDVDATVAKALTLGGQTAVPKMPIPGMGWLAYIVDTEGNILGVMQEDASAK